MKVCSIIIFQRPKHTWALAILMGMLSFQAQAENADNGSRNLAGYECKEPPQAAPNTANQWLERGLWASHCYAFQARAVVIDSVDVRTLALSHRIQDGIRQQVVQYLDGPSVSIERRSPVGRLAWAGDNGDDAMSSPARWAAHLGQYYRVTLEEGARVAERDAVKLAFEPLDQWRYSHEWWLDQDTGLLLKHVLNDQQEQVIETFQITQLESPQKYTGNVQSAQSNNAQSISDQNSWHSLWDSSWLPDGFVAQPITPTDANVNQRVYSDGLATVSIFVEPLPSDETPALQAGVKQLGVSAVAVEHYMSAIGLWQLVAIGELPVSTLQRIVRSITFDLTDEQTSSSLPNNAPSNVPSSVTNNTGQGEQ